MLTLYNQKIVEETYTNQWVVEPYLPYVASVIMETLNIRDDDEIALAFKRTFALCITLRIPINRNFKKIYCYNGETLIADWKVSSLAHYLITINCNPANEQVAKAQVYFAFSKSTKR